MNSALLDRHGMKAAPVIGLLLAGACLGAGLLALVSTERRLRGAAAARDTTGAGTAGGPALRASQDGYAAVARAVMPAVVSAPTSTRRSWSIPSSATSAP